jgi:hypothetical protein
MRVVRILVLLAGFVLLTASCGSGTSVPAPGKASRLKHLHPSLSRPILRLSFAILHAH